MMAKCVVCAILLPDSTQRHRLCISLEQVLLVVSEFVEWVCPVSIDQLLSSAGEKCFACQKYFSSAERVFKLRRSLTEEER